MLIRNVTALSCASVDVRTEVDVLIRNGKIAAVGKDLEGGKTGKGSVPGGGKPVRPETDEQVIDGTGRYLMPGLVNTHAHTAMTLLRGSAEDAVPEDWFNKYIWMYERNLTPDGVYLGSLLGAAEMLRAGVTTVADHYFSMERVFQAFEESGIRANLAWAVFGVGEQADVQLERALAFSADYSGRNSRISISLGPHSPYLCPDAFLKRVAEASEKLKLPMHIHVSEEPDQVRRSLADRGKTPVQVLADTGVLRPGTILAHAYHATDEDLDLIADRQSGIAHCAKTYLKFGDVKDLAPRALKNGIRIGLGSDGAASNNTMNIFEVGRDAALLAKASSGSAESGKIEEMIPLLCGGGRVLGTKQYGDIVPGAPADLLLINPETANMQPVHNIWANILYSLCERNIEKVIVDGRVVVHEGRLLTVDIDDLFHEIAEHGSSLLKDRGGGPMQTYDNK